MKTYLTPCFVLPALSLSQNFHLATYTASKRLTFIDAPSILDTLNGDSASLLKEIYEIITRTVEDLLDQGADSSSDPRALSMIVQDLSHLAWIGVRELDITRFYRAIRGFCLKVRPTRFFTRSVTRFMRSNDGATMTSKARGFSDLNSPDTRCGTSRNHPP